MRIAYDHQAFCRQAYGGVSRYFYHLIRKLSEAKQHQIHIFSPSYVNKYIRTLPPGIVYGKFQERYPLDATPLFRYLNTFTARPQIRRWHPDILHETYFSPIRTGPKNTPSVVTVYDMIHERFPEQFWAWDRTSSNKKRAIDRAGHVICISESTRQDLLEILDVPPEKVTTIHLAYEKYDTASGNEFSPPASAKNRPFILYVGHRNSYKNFNRLLEAVATSPQIFTRFDCVCFGGCKLTDGEWQLIKKLGLEDHIRQLTGSDQLLGQLYNTASAFVCPSLYEGFGLPPLEAMAHGCPVACSNTSSLPEVVGDAGELFDPLDIDSIRQALEKILFSTERREELIRKGYKRLTHFSWQKCAKQTLQIYKQVC